MAALRKVKFSNTRPVEPEYHAAVLHPNGRMECSVATTRAALKLAEDAGFKPGHFLFDVNLDENDFATFAPVALQTPDAGKVGLNKDGTCVMQLRELFDQYPEYRPVVRQRFTPIFETDANGQPCMSIGLKLGQDFPKAPRKAAAK